MNGYNFLAIQDRLSAGMTVSNNRECLFTSFLSSLNASSEDLIRQLGLLTRARRNAEAAYAVAANAYMEYEDQATTVAHEIFQAEAAFTSPLFLAKFEDGEYATRVLHELFERLHITPNNALEAARALEANPEFITKDFVDRGPALGVAAMRKADQLNAGPNRPVYLPRPVPAAASGSIFLTPEARETIERRWRSGHATIVPAVRETFDVADRPGKSYRPASAEHHTRARASSSSLSGGKPLILFLVCKAYVFFHSPGRILRESFAGGQARSFSSTLAGHLAAEVSCGSPLAGSRDGD